MEVLVNNDWKNVSGYEELYIVNRNGVVKSLGRIVNDSIGRTRVIKSKIMKQCISKNNSRIKDMGYKQSRLTDINGKSKAIFIHVIVAKAFILNTENKPTVNHIDGNKHNNNVNNLEWATYSENNQHAYNSSLKSDNRHCALINLNGDVLKEYISLHEAGRDCNVCFKAIWRVCNNLNTNITNLKFKYI